MLRFNTSNNVPQGRERRNQNIYKNTQLRGGENQGRKKRRQKDDETEL